MINMSSQASAASAGIFFHCPWPAMSMWKKIALLLLLVLAASTAHAQDASLQTRLDATTYQAVSALLDSARADGIPTQPMISKALEGASKGADGARIVAAVRRLGGELRLARQSLGAASTVAELDAGASAIHSGVDPRELTRLRAARPRQPLTIPLGMLADLVARGVPADSASSAALALARSSMRDEDFVAFRRNVERDIALGAPPAAAASLRVNASTRDAAFTNSALSPQGDPVPVKPRKP
jgi:hypothetical protein